LPTADDINPFDATWIGEMTNSTGLFQQGTISGTTVTWAALYGGYTKSGINPNPPPSNVGWLAATQPGYPTFSSQNNLVPGGLRFDPVTANRVWVTFGYGVVYYDLGASPLTLPNTGPLPWFTATEGIENMVATGIISQAGYDPFVFVEDQQGFQITSLTTPPANGAVSIVSRGANQSTWDSDASQSVSGLYCAFMTGHYVGNPSALSFSTNGGSSWTKFSSQPVSSDGGCITCVNSNVFLVVSTGNVTPLITTNGGSSWSTLSGVPSAEYCQYDFATSHMLTNDAAGTIFLFAPGSGLYKVVSPYSSASLVNSTDVLHGNPTVYLSSLRAVPGNAGYLFATYGQPSSGPSGTLFYKSVDGGVTWATSGGQMSNVQDVWHFGFGQVYPGWTFPTMWFLGFGNVGAGYKWGLWRSRDLLATDLVYITEWPAGHADSPKCLSGDMNDYTKVYIGYQGTSFVYGTGIT
jgi:hypothetical protein